MVRLELFQECNEARQTVKADIDPHGKVSHYARGVFLPWVEVVEELLMRFETGDSTANLARRDMSSQLREEFFGLRQGRGALVYAHA
jgi:hypothetical protein